MLCQLIDVECVGMYMGQQYGDNHRSPLDEIRNCSVLIKC